VTYAKRSGESNGDAGDQYTGLDRFGRVVDQRWIKTSGPTTTDRFQYGYDRDSNRTYRDNLVNTAFGEVYTTDGLNQVASFQRGTLNGNKDGITGTVARSQSWDYDALGNWDGVTTDGSGQTRTHNKQNEVSTVSGATSPTFDANGNMTTDETGKQFVYDAWNRLKVVKDSGGATLKTYTNDGLNRRVSETASGTTTDLYYSDQWQVLEERIGGVAKAQYVWSPEYVDALVLRDRDADGSGGNGLEERLWVHQDANWNVTALVNNSGVVQERYVYDPFGKVTVYDTSYVVRPGGSAYAQVLLFQGFRQDQISGLYEADLRWYSPSLGRWTTIDPILYYGGDIVLYRAFGNLPIGNLDPSGTEVLERKRSGGVISFDCSKVHNPNRVIATAEDKCGNKLELYCNGTNIIGTIIQKNGAKIPFGVCIYHIGANEWFVEYDKNGCFSTVCHVNINCDGVNDNDKLDNLGKLQGGFPVIKKGSKVDDDLKILPDLIKKFPAIITPNPEKSDDKRFCFDVIQYRYTNGGVTVYRLCLKKGGDYYWEKDPTVKPGMPRN